MLFKEKIKTKVNLEGFTKEEQNEIVDRLEENIIAKVNLVIVSELTDADRDEFYKISEKPYSPAMAAFLEKRIPDISKLITETADDIIDEFNTLREPV